jgi:hypothetical protein
MCDPMPCESRTTQLNNCSLPSDNENNKCYTYIEENKCYLSCPFNTEDNIDENENLICKEKRCSDRIPDNDKNNCTLSGDDDSNKCYTYIEENKCYSTCPLNMENINNNGLLICKKEDTCSDQKLNNENDCTIEDKCKIYKNICKLKCSTFTKSEKCRSDDCFWLYNESEGE